MPVLLPFPSSGKETCPQSHASSHDGTRSWQIPGLDLQDRDSHPSTGLRLPSPLSSLCSRICQTGPDVGPESECTTCQYCCKLSCVLCWWHVTSRATETWSRAMGHHGSPKWTKAFLSSQQMTAGSPRDRASPEGTASLTVQGSGSLLPSVQTPDAP